MADPVKINGKPNGKVSSLAAPSRKGKADRYLWTCEWKVGDWLKSDKNPKRATGIEVCWRFNGMKDTERYWTGGTNYESSTYGTNNGWDLGKWDNWKNWFPYTSQKLWAVNFWVRAYNSKGKGDWSHVKASIGLPKKPVLSPLVHDKESGRVSCNLTQDLGYDSNSPCQQIQYKVWVKDTRVSSEWQLLQNIKTRAEEIEDIGVDVTDRFQLDYSQFVHVQVEAWAAGFNGWTGRAVRDFFVCYPNQVSIISKSIHTKNADKKAVFNLRVPSSAPLYTSGMRLQKLVDVDYETIEEIPENARWEDTDIIDNEKCTALSIDISEIKPTPGKKTWVRVKTWKDFEDLFYRFSFPVRVTELEEPTPSAADDKIVLCSVVPDEDGESAIATIGWNTDGTDDSDLTELTWSENPNAWISTHKPNSFEFDWSDGALEWTDDTDPLHPVHYSFLDSAVVHVEELKEGTMYYVRARRKKDFEGETTYSPYTKTKTILTSTEPLTVSLDAPSYIARGDSLPLSWVYSTEAKQTEWQVLLGHFENDVFIEELIVDSGDDAIGSCLIRAERLTELLEGKDSAAFAVRVSTGGDYIVSEGRIVGVADSPVLTMSVPSVVSEPNPEISFTCTTDSNISLTITANGAISEYPDGEYRQISGDTIYTEMLLPVWENGATTVTLPDMNLWNNAAYTIKAVAVDNQTSLSSEAVEGEFSVTWGERVSSPPDTIMLVPHDEIDDDGFRLRYVVIALLPPESSDETDVYDVYRCTADGVYLIAEGQDQYAVVTDYYAPYGNDNETVYRVALRALNGDVSWADYPYELSGNDLRIDWNGMYVELPYNLVLNDSYLKDFEARPHLGDGTPEGYWNENVGRSASLSTDLIKIKEKSKISAIRNLARYPRGVFIRTPNGCAYQANVDISGLEESYAKGGIAISIDATEIALTDAYKAVVPESKPSSDPEGD